MSAIVVIAYILVMRVSTEDVQIAAVSGMKQVVSGITNVTAVTAFMSVMRVSTEDVRIAAVSVTKSAE